MANNRIAIRRTSVSGRVPNTSQVNIGELALNLADQILYSSNGSTVFELGANNTNVNISGNATIAAIIANGSIGLNGQTLTSNGSAVYWSAAAGTGTVTQVNTGVGLAGGPLTTTGTLSVNQAYSFTWTNVHTFNANISISNGSAIIANGSSGANGQILMSNGTATYWANSTGGVYMKISSNTSAIAYSNHLLNTANGSIYVSLPVSPTIGLSVVFADGGGDKLINPAYILTSNNISIEDQDTVLQFDMPNFKCEFVYTGDTWKVFAA